MNREDSYWIRWSSWTNAGMVLSGQMPRKKILKELQRFEVEAKKVL